MLKFIEPMLRLHISGLACSGAARRSSSVIFSPPPVVTFTTASVDCLMIGRKRMNTAGSGVGSPVSGLRACRWMIAAPASAASMLLRAICSGVIGRCSDMLGVWIAPVTAQLMMTFAIPAPPMSRDPAPGRAARLDRFHPPWNRSSLADTGRIVRGGSDELVGHCEGGGDEGSWREGKNPRTQNNRQGGRGTR